MADQETTDPFILLDRGTLEDWAGSGTSSRGKGYQREGRVHNLALGEDHTLVAWVDGSERYATAVWFDDGLHSACTCPVKESCKHAVAVILEYIALCEKKTAFPSIDAGDPRCRLVGIRSGTGSPGILVTEPCVAGPAATSNSIGRSPEIAGYHRQYLESMKKAELVDLLLELMDEFPDVEEDITDRRSVASDDARPLYKALLIDIDSLTEEEAWSDSWSGKSQIPDYSPVRKRMELLLEMGYPDLVIDAGSILLKKGNNQVEQADDDEGETSREISSCMDLVIQALLTSDRPVHERLLFAINMNLDDEFDLCGGAGAFLDKTWPEASWSLVADQLLHELDSHEIPQEKADYHKKYLRDNLTSWIMTTLDKSGRVDEATNLAVAEAKKTGSYVRLVRRLIRLGKAPEAAAAIRSGIESCGKESAGSVRELRDLQREMWVKTGDLRSAAGLLAEEFLCNPSTGAFFNLKAAAKKAGVWDAAASHIERYLTSGEAPVAEQDEAGSPPVIFGTLPASGLTGPGLWKSQKTPFYTILIDRSIADGQPEEAVEWFDRFRAERGDHGGCFYPENKLWDMVKGRFPDRAIAFWKENAVREVQTAMPKGYDRGFGYLTKIRALMMQLGRDAEWEAYLAGLRQEHARKKKFISMLKDLDTPRIVRS